MMDLLLDLIAQALERNEIQIVIGGKASDPAPWIEGKEHDEIYFFKCPREIKEFFDRLKDTCDKDRNSFRYDGKWDFEYNENKTAIPTMRNYFLPRVKSGVAMTVETSYSGSENNRFTAERICSLGGHFYRGLASTILQEVSEGNR